MKKATFGHIEHLVDYTSKRQADEDKAERREAGWIVNEEYDNDNGYQDKNGNYIVYTIVYRHAIKGINGGW